MAKSNPATVTEMPKLAKPPVGFQDEGRPDIDGWLKPAEGLVVHGKICGAFSFIQRMRDGTSKVRTAICVTVLQPTPASLKGDVSVNLEPGQVLAMSMMYCLTPLMVYVENKGEIWVQFKNTVGIGGGQKVWKADVFGKGRKAAAPILTAPTVKTEDVSDSDASEPWDA